MWTSRPLRALFCASIPSWLVLLSIWPPFSFLFYLLYLGDSQDPTAELQWESIDNSIYCLDNTTLVVSLGTLSLDRMFACVINLNHQ